MKNMIMIIILASINHKKRRFVWAPEIYFRYELLARKVMVDFKFDALYSYVEFPEVRLVKKLTRRLYS